MKRNTSRSCRVTAAVPRYAEQQPLPEHRGWQGAEGGGDAALTVNNDLDHPEVDFSPGHDTGLAVVHALVCLLDAADLQVAVRFETESH